MDNNEILKQLEDLLIITCESEKREISKYLKLLSEGKQKPTNDSSSCTICNKETASVCEKCLATHYSTTTANVKCMRCM